MVLKIYISSTSGNKEIKKKQEFIKQVLETKKICFEEIDISLAICEEDRKYMREHAKARGTPNPLPPQVFSDQDYLGDYEDFHEANECDELFEFLKMAPSKKQSSAEIVLDEVNGDKDHKATVKCTEVIIDHYDEDKENTEQVLYYNIPVTQIQFLVTACRLSCVITFFMVTLWPRYYNVVVL
ncbi:hypothetical protein LSH36_150g02027 [Paralvinella palmiformis]|uniref:SH3 domain-binding glutamic acid-rich-like protein n=1 Tax=Paralvinella palmiformis TaxID=53620 RepID=A0AAD9JUD9_9ANNE|nr:hypothetical protein LSH36_150g02027 [Paralvinella palmiformis]